MRIALVLVVAACGSQAAAPPPSPRTPAPPVPRADAPAAAVTCGEVGVILRGPVEDDADAGPVKEATIARACLHDRWSREVMDCVGSSVLPQSCLDKLTPEQTAGYRKRLLAWVDAYPDEELDIEDEPLGDDDLSFVNCQIGIGDVSRYAPVVTATGKRRELAVSLRRYHILDLCGGWEDDVRRCFADGTAPAACRKLLAPDQEQDLADRLAEVDAVMKKVDALKPPVTCAKAVQAHYATARWKGALLHTKPAERTQVIAKARKLMADACKSEQWSDNLRACVAALGNDACFHASNVATWGFPPGIIPVKTGIPECDAYGDVLRALAKCSGIPKQASQSMLESYQRMVQAFATMSADKRTAAASSCKQAEEAIRQSAQNLGCKI